MKKKVLAILGVEILIALVCTVFAINHKSNSQNGSPENTYSDIDEANKAADFPLEHSDRLCGYPATEYNGDGVTAEEMTEYVEATV